MAKAFRELIGVAPSTVSINDSVLIIIDAQNEYISGHLKTENVSSTRKAISDLLERYRAANAPLIHITHQTPEGAPVFTPNTDLAKPFPELTPTSHETHLQKNFPGSFTGTGLDEEIKRTERKQIVLVGYMAHVCVSTTARQGAEKGYDVIVVRDAVGDRDIPGVKAQQLVDVVLAELADAFATVVDSKDIK